MDKKIKQNNKIYQIFTFYWSTMQMKMMHQIFIDFTQCILYLRDFDIGGGFILAVKVLQ